MTSAHIDTPTDTLSDVQASADARQLPIQRVGIKRVKWPLAWAAQHGVVHSVAEFEMSVYLPAEQKGTHMSRFVAALNETTAVGAAPWSVAQARVFVADLLERLHTPEAYFKAQFTLFLPRSAPVSGITSLMDYQVTLHGEAKAGQPATIRLEIQAPVTSLCPCSKEIADYGAHNQRSHITITATASDDLSPEAMIAWAENSASAQLYPLLKRADEKYVTERAYDNPKFVEDLIRDVAIAAKADARAQGVVIEAENFESIHNHSAYARLWVR